MELFAGMPAERYRAGLLAAAARLLTCAEPHKEQDGFTDLLVDVLDMQYSGPATLDYARETAAGLRSLGLGDDDVRMVLWWRAESNRPTDGDDLWAGQPC